MQETWVQSLAQEDLLEEEMATNSSICAWKTPWTDKPGGIPWNPWDCKESEHDWATNTKGQLIYNKGGKKNQKGKDILYNQ